ncbi:MAG: hypothetical protein KJO18_06795, partial [Acidimicrobiia bacterium]|nr:hypothetical protein [Acidimicrobiia bacterium]
MQNLQIEVFPKTSTRSMLRLKDHEGTLIKERPLDADRIDQFISEIQDGYRQVSPVLRELGHDLYTFLDGDDRWLGAALDDPSGTVLHIDADERLRHLPWELMAPNGEYLAIDIVKPFSTVVRVSDHASEVERANRELRILLMATSPEDVQPVLEFEREEGLILDATRDAPVELFV